MWPTLCATSGMKLIVVGDWGDIRPEGIVNQQAVADQMATWCEVVDQCEFIISTGDNFYPQGVTAPDDPRFNTSWLDVYNQPSLVDKTWYISIGNHDHDLLPTGDGREWNQVCTLTKRCILL